MSDSCVHCRFRRASHWRRDLGRRIALNLICLTILGAPTVVRGQGETTPTGPAIAVSPARIEVEIGERPITESIRVMNLTDRVVETRVTLATWDLDDANQLREIEPTPQSLDQWIVVNPVHFTIAAGSSQVVRFAIRPRVQPEPGEHRAMVFLHEVEPEHAAATSSQVRFLFRLGVAVYGHVGPVERTAVLHGARLDHETNPTQVLLDVEATGTAHARLTGEVRVEPLAPTHDSTSDAPELANPLPTIPVLPGYRRTIPVPVPRPSIPGAYTVHLRGTLGDSLPVDWAAEFQVTAPAEPTPTIPQPIAPVDKEHDGGRQNGEAAVGGGAAGG